MEWVNLIVTSAAGLLNHLEPLLAESAATAGFRSVETVSEADCLQAALAASDDRPALVVDIGETATRLYRVTADSVTLHAVRIPGAANANEDMRNFILDHRRVVIGRRATTELLGKGASPDGKHIGRSIDNGLPKTFGFDNDDLAMKQRGILNPADNHLLDDEEGESL